MDEQIKENFILIYKNCKCAKNSKVLLDRSFLHYLNGDTIEALEYAEKYITTNDEKSNDIFTLTQKAMLLNDLGEFFKAIENLSRVIKNDPSNKEAYFQRSIAHFETGNFEDALDDYLNSKNHRTNPKSSRHVSSEFSQALLKNVLEGATESCVDFFPSLCSTVYGLSETLWITAQHPLESSKNFAISCYEIGEFISEYSKQVNPENLDLCVRHLKTLYENFDHLTDNEKGSLIGYTIGKYGVELFAGTAVFKGFKAYQNLKNANRICNLEAMTISKTNKKKVISSAQKHSSQRDAYLKNVNIEWDKQNKHVIGKHNYEPGKGIFEHPDPERLLNTYAGKGTPINKKQFGMPDYRERVDFGEFIGYFATQDIPRIYLPTNKGIVHYSKKGAHIIPSNPDGF